MIIVGVDYHPSVQQVAFLDTETGETGERTTAMERQSVSIAIYSEDRILVHGARSAVLRVKRERSPFSGWLDALEQRGRST